MLHVFRNRLATCLLSVVYLAAGAAGNLLHSHVHGDHVHGGVAGETCHHGHGPNGHDEHSHHDHDGNLAPDSHQGLALVTTSAGHHVDCTICRAAGQRVVPVQRVQFVELCGLVEPLRLVLTDEPISVAARTHHSRAPPRAG